jgi:hypothetical protein
LSNFLSSFDQATNAPVSHSLVTEVIKPAEQGVQHLHHMLCGPLCTDLSEGHDITEQDGHLQRRKATGKLHVSPSSTMQVLKVYDKLQISQHCWK